MSGFSGSTWTFSTFPETGGSVVSVLPAPERNDTYQATRSQEVAVSKGGQVFVQDLGVEDEFLILRWLDLDGTAWSGLRRVFRAAGWRSRRIQIDVSDGPAGQAFPVWISPGQVVSGLALSPGQGHSPGDTVMATVFSLSVSLDQSQDEWEHQQERRGSIALRFRTLDNGSYYRD